MSSIAMLNYQSMWVCSGCVSMWVCFCCHSFLVKPNFSSFLLVKRHFFSCLLLTRLHPLLILFFDAWYLFYHIYIYIIYIYVYYKYIYIYIHTHYTYIFIYIYTLYIHMFCMFKKKALFFSMVSYPPKATLPPSSAAGRRKSSTAGWRCMPPWVAPLGLAVWVGLHKIEMGLIF